MLLEGRGKELAGEWAGYRSRTRLAYASDRDGCVWEPGPGPAASSLTTPSARPLFFQKSCRPCWLSRLMFGVHVWSDTGYVAMCALKYHSHPQRMRSESC